MSPQTTGQLALPVPPQRRGWWRRAFADSGVTPFALGVIAALVVARAASWALRGEDFVYFAARNIVAIGWMAAAIVLLVVAAAQAAPPRGPRRVAVIAAAVLIAPPLGVLLRLLSREVFGWGPPWAAAPSMLAQLWPRFAVVAALFALFIELYRREAAAAAAARQAAADQAALERESAAAELQLLEAQIEPHFVFNSLGTVRRLGGTDRAAAAALVASLMRYLDAALPALRGAAATLSRELQLVEAYLAVQQARFGARLRYEIDAAPALEALPLPPAMLLTLVENAIKHGLQPAPQGGTVRVSARSEGAQLVLTVADTGVGFKAGSGRGTGLANIRARLAAQFGAAAGLELGHNDFGGVSATLRLPLPLPLPGNRA